jgi:hypothetical protein
MRMTFQRSYENAEAAALRDRRFVPQARAAVNKLATGNYDWLGVRRSGRFVLGRPRLSAIAEHGDGVLPDDAPHRVETRGPLDRGAHREPYATPDEARAAYERIIAGGPVIPLRSSGVRKGPARPRRRLCGGAARRPGVAAGGVSARRGSMSWRRG